MALGVLYLVLFAQLNRVQFFGAQRLQENPINSRGLIREFGRERGRILAADGVVLARSVPSIGSFDNLREYPEGDLFAHVVGYQSLNVGATGIEREYNDELAGTKLEQQLVSLKDLFRRRDSTATLTLTIRDDVQRVARDALGDRRGSVVAIDPRTGEILALWTWPTFDPNLLAAPDGAAANQAYQDLLADSADPLLAKSYRELFFPGSTFKLVTATAALGTGIVTASSPVMPESNSYQPIPAGRPIANFAGETCGGDLFEILRVSCNTAFAEIGAEWVGPGAMVATAEAYGFNSVPPLDLPVVAASKFPTDYGKRLADVQHYRGALPGGSSSEGDTPEVDAPGSDAAPDGDTSDGDVSPAGIALPNGAVGVCENTARLAQASIGQNDVAATPLQMAMVAAAIANDGLVMAPHVVSTVTAADGRIYSENKPQLWKIASSRAIAETMRNAMINVAATGTATRLAIPGYLVGGKTGTAQLGTNPPNSHAWIVGFAGPIGGPAEVAVAVIVEAQDGASEQTGGVVAAPIGRAVMEAILGIR